MDYRKLFLNRQLDGKNHKTWEHHLLMGHVLDMFHWMLWDTTDNQTWAAGKSTSSMDGFPP